MTASQYTTIPSSLRAYGWAGVSTPEQARSEKESLPAQRRDIQSAARQLGVNLLEILEVPGFSRNYIDFYEMRDDMAREGISAPARLQTLWEKKAIDLFICKDADRFGRTIPLLSYIAGQIIFTAGARIYVASNGIFIDRENFDEFISMFGLMASSEIKRLRKRYETGMYGRFSRGLHGGGNLPFTHMLVGEREHCRLVVDTSKLPLLQDMAELMIAGVTYDDLPEKLEARGHVNPETGQRYSIMFPRIVLYSPFTWGHVARRFKRKRGPWAYDESVPVPAGVEVARNVIPPAYTGELAEKLMAELRRRETIITGRASPTDTHRYRGLLRCAQCGMGMVYNSGTYYYCPRNQIVKRLHKEHEQAPCTNRKFIREDRLNEQVGDFLYRWIELNWDDLSLPGEDTGPDTRLKALEAESSSVEARLRRLIHLQANAPLVTTEFYQAEIKTLGDRLAFLRSETARVQALRPSPALRHERRRAKEEIAALGVARFLEQSDLQVNQTLHQILGRSRFVVEGGAIVDIHHPEV